MEPETTKTSFNEIFNGIFNNRRWTDNEGSAVVRWTDSDDRCLWRAQAGSIISSK